MGRCARRRASLSRPLPRSLARSLSLCASRHTDLVQVGDGGRVDQLVLWREGRESGVREWKKRKKRAGERFGCPGGARKRPASTAPRPAPPRPPKTKPQRTGTFFCVTMATQSLPRTPTAVLPAFLALLNAYSAGRGKRMGAIGEELWGRARRDPVLLPSSAHTPRACVCCKARQRHRVWLGAQGACGAGGAKKRERHRPTRARASFFDLPPPLFISPAPPARGRNVASKTHQPGTGAPRARRW